MADATAVENVVRAFNSLPIPENTPSGHANHWQFIIRHVPFSRPTDVVQIVHPDYESNPGFIFLTDAAQIFSLPTVAAQLNAAILLFLPMFLGQGSDPNSTPTLTRHFSWSHYTTEQFAPWSWSTNNQAFAVAAAETLRLLGVRHELCTVTISNKQQNEAADQTWAESMKCTMDELKLTLRRAGGGAHSRPACHGCDKDSTWFSDGLKQCTKCLKVQYCSGFCQMSDWSQHRSKCRNPESEDELPSNESTGNITSANASDKSARKEPPKNKLVSKVTSPNVPSHSVAMKPPAFFDTVSYRVPEAVDLLRSIGLTLLPGQEFTYHTLRRLVLTGNDTPHNLALIYGPNWPFESAGQSQWNKIRMDVFFRRPTVEKDITDLLDLGFKFAPRPVNEVEIEQMRKASETQEAHATRDGSRWKGPEAPNQDE